MFGSYLVEQVSSSFHMSLYLNRNYLLKLVNLYNLADLGEDIQKTATREVFEETGVKAGKLNNTPEAN